MWDRKLPETALGSAANHAQSREKRAVSERLTWRMPQLGNGVDSAVILEWMVGIGEAVEEGEPVVTVETDKATTDLEAPVTGTLAVVHADDGVEIDVGEPLAEFDRA